MKRPLIVILGATASGKTAFAVQLAQALKGEIISADSRQVYRELNIGTGKDYEAYSLNGTTVPHHLIDILEANEHFDLSKYLNAFNEAYHLVLSNKKLPILCGGTGLYIEAILKGYNFPFVPIDENLRTELLSMTHDSLKSRFALMKRNEYTDIADLSTVKRTIRAIEISKYLVDHDIQLRSREPFEFIVFGVKSPIDRRIKNIEERLRQRVKEGMLEEAMNLLDKLGKDRLMRFGLEYKFQALYLTGEITYEKMVERLSTAIRQYAKRQMTYFRKMERSGIEIHWIDPEKELDEAISMASDFTNK